MPGYHVHVWKKIPFLKLLIGMIAGILLQWHFQFSTITGWLLLLISSAALLCFFFIPFFNRYKLVIIPGIAGIFIFFSLGIILTQQKDTRNDKDWMGNYYNGTQALLLKIDEPLAEKTKSLKANARVLAMQQDNEWINVNGKIILYFKKELSGEKEKSVLQQLTYGSQLIIKKPLQEIKKAGNPGGFDYKRYSLFKGITHQLYLQPGEFVILNNKTQKDFRQFIYTIRNKVLQILRRNIKGAKELGLAEALLIGYKDDLEQSLVQSYTNTGVVHIIAISGLHLGLIYWLLTKLFNPLRRKKKIKWMVPVFIITGLWLFSFLAGAQASILRSAVMFTCIVAGESFRKKTSVYNTMAISAFILLCINPFWLWDVGFQLSYAAVLSIITFVRPIYNWFYFKNKIVDFFWKLNAVTLAAQILTLPVSIYHFHQFPVLFILSNFFTVPLASAILIGLILLVAISFLPTVALLLGKLIAGFIWLMNTYIERVEAIPFSLWDELQIDLWQTFLLLLFAAGTSYWLIEKSRHGLKFALFTLLSFTALRSYSFIKSNQQQKIIVYNVPQKKAIDIVNGRNYYFIGDSDLLADDFARNFHLKPSRIRLRVEETDSLPNLSIKDHYLTFNDKQILLLDTSITFNLQEIKPSIDLLVISKNPKLYMKKLAAALDIRQVVFDGSVPAWKTKYWKADCDSLGIPWHDVTMKGAFVMEMK